MSNDEFQKLYEQYNPMINSFVRKYKGLLEAEEIKQICLIAIMKAHNSYNPNTNMKFDTWVYQNMQWKLYKEIRDIKHLTRNCISLEDTLQDNINIQEEVEDRLMVQTYKDEIIRCLDPKKADAMILKYFEFMPNNYIEKALDITGVSNYIRESRMTLIRKSPLFHDEYVKISGISDYRTETLALI